MGGALTSHSPLPAGGGGGGKLQKVARKKTKNNTDTQTPRVLDNRGGGKVGDFLKRAITPGAQVRAVSAYFSIHAHRALKDQLEDAQKFQFLFGDPKSVAELGEDAVQKPYYITEGGITPDFDLEELKQKYAARDCAKWLKHGKENGAVAVKTLTSGFLHGKMYDVEQSDGKGAAVSGSSNFTARGLGFARDGGNWELNTVADDKTRAELRKWFDDLWNSGKVESVEDKMLETLNRLGRDEAPEFVYFLTLYRLFKDKLEAAKSEEDLRLGESEIWNTLYQFQKDAVSGIIDRLLQHRVCILADSVGLGKTYTALAVMKFYQNQRVLVLCPKRLENNWTQFLRFTKGYNPLETDKFNYQVYAHTDLGRDNLNVDWEKFDLVVIDESHNFRNANGDRYKILSDAVHKSNAKVLMLSATPINTSLKDLRNQILLATENGAFARTLGINSVTDTAALSQKHFSKWETGAEKDPDALMEKLGGKFLKLMDAVTIARSRRHIKKFYVESITDDLLDFPETGDPEALHPPTDSEGELSYADIHQRIGDFGLSVYSPSAHLLGEETKQGGFFQSDRESNLIKMMRVNLLKRLESSVFSFRETMGRTMKRIRAIEQTIVAYQNSEEQDLFGTVDALPDDDPDDDEFVVGDRYTYKLSELRLDDWLKDLREDREKLQAVLNKAQRITPERDAKLIKLKDVLLQKFNNPTRDKNGGENRKALVFTSFADTAGYLYDELAGDDKFSKIKIAKVIGAGRNQTNAAGCPLRYNDILHHFSPGKDEGNLTGREIDILIATDCVSEGQNLQDCDLVINYDIHWNPVRIVQRFGRVDRLGSPMEKVKMINFWPDITLDKYLSLKDRVEARMALVKIGGAVDATGGTETEANKILNFRNRQLRDLHKQALDADDIDGVTASDLTMADFLAELRAYLEKNEEKFKRAPEGVCAVVPVDAGNDAHAGVIFCLRRNNAENVDDNEQRKGDNPQHPYYLVYVREGENGKPPKVCFSYARIKKSLQLFGDLCRGKTKALAKLCAAFDAETGNGKNMAKYDAMLGAAIKDIAREAATRAGEELSRDRAAELLDGGYEQTPEDFELSSWLVIRGEGK